jgi:Carboxypeptidase regulatory-like domain
MSRYRALFIFACLALLLSMLFLRPGEAQKARKPQSLDKSDTLKTDGSSRSGNSSAQQRGSKPAPVSVQAVGFAESAPVRTLSAEQHLAANSQGGPPEVNPEGREINELNAERVRINVPGPSFDGALQTSTKTKSGKNVPNVLPAPIFTFEGQAEANNNPVAPPDTNGAVGPNHYVQTVNNHVRIFNKAGVQIGADFLQSSLFANLGGVCAASDKGDPVVLYDRMANRWILTQFGFTALNAPPYHECVAISRTPDPTGSYFAYDFQLPGTEFPDYPKLGSWPDAYYMSTNQFNNGGPFDGVGAFAFDRSKMLVGDPSASFIYFNLNLTTHPEGIFGMLPSDHDGLLPPPAGVPNVFIYFTNTQFGDPADGLRLFNFHADFTTPANSTFLETQTTYATPLPLSAFDARVPGGRGHVKQPPPASNVSTGSNDNSDRLDSVGERMMYRLQYFNRNGVESLVSNFTVNVSGNNITGSNSDANQILYQAGFRYFQLQRNNPVAPYAVAEQATFAPGANNAATGPNRWMASAAADNQNNLAVGYSISSTSINPSLNYAARAFNDPPNGLFQGEGTLFAGTGVQRQTSHRWGDYSALQVDPSDDCTFWFTSEYYTSTTLTFNWQTRVGAFKFPTCTAPAQGTLAGTVTACDTGQPLQDALVTVSGGPSNGYSTTTLANGTYSMNLAPGTYTVTITDSVHSCSSTGTFPGVVINNGATTTQNACLTGSPSLVLQSTALSGGNGNGVIDRDECNNLNVTIQNIGCLTASNVSAVLSSSTPGVTITQPNSPYPNIPENLTGTNTVPFSVSTSPSFVCGTPIQFTLTVNYTGGPKAINFSLPTCACPANTVNDSITAGDPDAVSRLGRNGITSNCGSPKACPGAIDTTFNSNTTRKYHLDNFVNGPTATCATITFTANCNTTTNPVIPVAYLGSFNPNNLCTNYLGDPGGSPNTVGVPISFSVNVPANATLVVCTQEVNHNQGGCSGYTVSVSGLVCNTDAGAQCQACSITCPNNIDAQTAPMGNSAVVNYPDPQTSGTCGVVTCNPASGSVFPLGVTTVNCSTTAGPSCSFKVNVHQPTAHPRNPNWTSAGSTGTIDEDSTSKIRLQDFTTRFFSNQTGTGTIRYNITATEGFAYCPATQSTVKVRYRNSDSTGAHSQVKFEIHRTNINTGGNQIIFTFNSNGTSNGNGFLSATQTPNIDFDFANYVYWIEGTIFRDSTTQAADLGSIEIFENAGTLCP